MISQLIDRLNQLDLPDATWVGLRGTQETQTHHALRDGHPETNGTTFSQGVMVEVLVKGQIGYAATPNLQPASIKAAADRAYDCALAAGQWQLTPTSLSVRPRVVGEYRSPDKSAFEKLSPGEINDLLSEICRRLKRSAEIVQVSAGVLLTKTETWFVSSNGSEVYQCFHCIGTDFAATAQRGSVTQRRSDNGWFARCYQGGLEHLVSPDLWERVNRIGQEALDLLDAEECPEETMTLVLAPDQMLLQIHESVGHPLELDRILGDERNYAGGSFVQPEDFGHLVYGSPLMNITFDPTIQGEFASYAFDDTGAPATREYLIREGTLQRGLGSLESQERLGVKGVACARANSWNRPPIDRMANLNLEPGNESFDQLIGRIERGIYMESNRSWSIDDRRHKFQFSCEYGRLIENGKLTRPVRNPNYRGTTPEFWASLTGLGNGETWQMYGTPTCGKGEPNQAIAVGHGSPVAVFNQIEVFGGDA
jgi:predicted Zn-dependent protease